MKKEAVNHPSHYSDGSAPCECIDAIHYIVNELPPEVAFGIGNVQKYIWRLGKKEPDADQTREEKILEDIQKAEWYLHDAAVAMLNCMGKKAE